MRFAWLTAALLVLLASACGGDGGTAPDATAAAAVSITSPEDGATVASTFGVAMAADAFVVEPAGDVRDGAGHFHLVVDGDCVRPGEQIPADDTHVRLADGATETELTLSPGRHTLCLQAGDGQHAALGLTDMIAVNVAGGTGTSEQESVSEWSGRYEGEVVWDCGAAGTHRGRLEADVRIVESPGSGATLVAEHTVTGSCADTGTRTTPVRVDGERTSSGFTFPAALWGVAGTLRLSISGDRLQGRLTGRVPGPGRVTILFDLDCDRGC